MGVKRVVDSSFWTDGKVDEFTPEDKYFMLYLLTNPFSRQLGIYEISIKQMAFQLGYSKDSVMALLERFEKKYGIIIVSQETSVTVEIAILNFLRHSVMKGGKPVEDCIKQDMERVKNKKLIESVFLHLHGKDGLNVTVKKIIDEYINNNDIYNDNDNDNDRTDNESCHDSSKGEQLSRKTKAEKEKETLILKVCEFLGKHNYSLFSDGAEELRQAIVSFVEFRKGIKKPMTERAIDLLIGKLKNMTPDTHKQIEIINQSIMNGWQGIFPLKEEMQTARRPPYQKQSKADELNDFYEMAATWAEGE